MQQALLLSILPLTIPTTEPVVKFSPQSLQVLNIILSLIMFGIALELKAGDFTAFIKNKKSALAGLGAHFILLPMLTFALVKILHPAPAVALGMILVCACPGGNMCNMFTHLAKGNTALAVGLTTLSHLLAIGLTPLNFAFYGSLDNGTATLLKEIHLSFMDVFQAIVLVVGIPLVAGILISKYRPLLAEKLNKVMKKFSLMAFAFFLIAAVAGNIKAFTASLTTVMPLVMIHNVVALSAGYLFARSLKLQPQDCKTITFETGIQNSGLGLILIFTFFNGMSGMALVAACWGVWPLVTGGFLSWYWGRDRKVVLANGL